jgi:hypothetical protein
VSGAIVSGAGDVMQGAWVFKAKGSGHEVSIARKKVLRQDPTPEACARLYLGACRARCWTFTGAISRIG